MQHSILYSKYNNKTVHLLFTHNVRICKPAMSYSVTQRTDQYKYRYGLWSYFCVNPTYSHIVSFTILWLISFWSNLSWYKTKPQKSNEKGFFFQGIDNSVAFYSTSKTLQYELCIFHDFSAFYHILVQIELRSIS